MLLGLARGIGGRDLRLLAPGIVFLGVLMSMTGIVQKALWSGKVYGFWEPVNKGVVAFGPFINRNHFAGWMLLALPVAVGYFAALVARGMVGVKPGWRNRVIWFSTPDASRAVLTGFAILVMGFALTLTLSRSGISCFLLAMVLSAFHVLRRQTSTAKGRLLGAYLALVVVAAVAWVGIDAIGARFAEVDWKLGGRAGAWGDAWRIHQAFPWFGTGLNTYGSATLLLQEFEKATAHYVEAHNDYLQLLVEGGWLVAVPALVLVGLFAREVRRRFREGRDDGTGYWLRLGAVTGIVAIAFQEIVEFSLQMPGNAAFFTVLCAMAVRKASVKGQRGESDSPDGRLGRCLPPHAALAGDALGEEDLQQRLIGHIPLVRQGLEFVEQRRRQAKGNRGGRRLQRRERRAYRLAPVEEVDGVVTRPELAFCVLVREPGRLPTHPLRARLHTPSVPAGSCPWPKSP